MRRGRKVSPKGDSEYSTAFGGASPFQAEIYFINLAGIIQVKFGVPFFDVADARNTNFTVPVAVRDSINFRVTNYKEFIKLHRLIDFDLEAFKLQIRDAVCKYIKSIVTNIPFDTGIADKKQWYFGNLDAYHIAFSRGYQLQTPMLPNGKTTEKIRSYAFRSIWEETTPTITGYSSLWRIPKITGVY